MLWHWDGGGGHEDEEEGEEEDEQSQNHLRKVLRKEKNFSILINLDHWVHNSSVVYLEVWHDLREKSALKLFGLWAELTALFSQNTF